MSHDQEQSITSMAPSVTDIVHRTIYLNWPVAEKVWSAVPRLELMGDISQRVEEVRQFVVAFVRGFNPKDAAETATLLSRTLLTTIADRSTSLQLRMNAAVVIGSLFKEGYFGGDVFMMLIGIFSNTLGGVATPEMCLAIGAVLCASDVRPTPLADDLRKLLHSSDGLKELLVLPGDKIDVVETLHIDPLADLLPHDALSVEHEKRTNVQTRPSVPSDPDEKPEISRKKASCASQLSASTRADRMERTVYISRLDPTVTTAALRSVLVACGQFLRVRLCGDDCSRTRYCFVEFAEKQGAKAMAAQSGAVVGGTPIRVGPAKKPIQDSDPRDAVIDSRRGVIRGCLFGVQVTQEQLQQFTLSRSAALSRSSANSKSGQRNCGSTNPRSQADHERRRRGPVRVTIVEESTQ